MRVVGVVVLEQELREWVEIERGMSDGGVGEKDVGEVGAQQGWGATRPSGD